MKRRVSLSVALIGSAIMISACETKSSGPTNPDEPAPGELPLPEFTECTSTEAPVLPEKWAAVALLQDFVGNHLVFGKFVYDESVEAFRSTLTSRYNDAAEVDLLVTEDGALYWLVGGYMPSSCQPVSNSLDLAVPSRTWPSEGSSCVGEAPILEKNQQWWKSPRGEGADWYWYWSEAGTNVPFRQMFYADPKPPEQAPIYQHFTFNYFPEFQAVDSTNLGEILALCENSKAEPIELGIAGVEDIESLVPAGSYPTPNADAVATIQGWIPGLTECSSVGDLPPPWPDKTQASVFMTAVNPLYDPFPTRVYYDWTQQAQNTSLYYYNPPDPSEYVQVALLTGDTGYIRIENEAGHINSCEQALPGPQVPNWNEVDGCECRAQLAPNTVLNPGSTPTKILWCPTDLSAQQVFWTWYTDEGSPVVFMQSNSSPTAGTGLNLADYYGWAPGSTAPGGTFHVPEECLSSPKEEVPQACHNCHLPLNTIDPSGS